MTHPTELQSVNDADKSTLKFDGSTVERAIKPAPDKPTGQCPPMTWWPSPVQADQSDPTWSHSGRGQS